MFWPLYPQERILVPIELGDWLGHRAGHDVFGEERSFAPYWHLYLRPSIL